MRCRHVRTIARTEPLERRVLFAAGDLDPTFGGGDGWAHLFDGNSFDGGPGQATAVVALADGSLVLAGEYWRALPVGTADVELALAKYRPDGTPDATFGAGGADGDAIVSLDDGWGSNEVRELLVAPGGKFLVFGKWANADNRTAVFRVNPNGTPDATFGEGGRIFVEGSPADVDVQGDGRVLFLQGRAVRRYNADGTADTTFGAAAGGTAPLDFAFGGGPGGFSHLAALPGGKVLLAGYRGAQGEQVLTFARLSADGSPDSTFGGGDGVATDPADVDLFALAALPDGRFLAAGQSGAGPISNAGADFTVARYDADGTPDATFGTGGRAVTVPRPRPDGYEPPGHVDKLIPFPDGRVLALGSSGGRTLLLYKSDGSLDATFGDGGVFYFTPDGSNGNLYPHISDIVVQPIAGRLITVGRTFLRVESRVWPQGEESTPVPPPGQDVTPPSVEQLFGITDIRRDDETLRFMVHFRDDRGVDASSLDGNEVRVIGPGGAGGFARLVGDPGPNEEGRSWAAAYEFVPDGGFTTAHNGTYTLSIEPGSVRDTSGLAVPAGPLPGGTLNVAIPAAGPNLAVSRAAVRPRRFVGGAPPRGRASFVLRNADDEAFAGAVEVIVTARLRTEPGGEGASGGASPSTTVQVNLRPAQRRRYSIPVGTFSSLLPAGTYDLAVVVDPYNALAETSKRDSTATAPRPAFIGPAATGRGRGGRSPVRRSDEVDLFGSAPVRAT